MLARKEEENMALFFHLPALNFNHISHFMFPTAAALWQKQRTKDVLVVKPSSPTTFMISTSCTRVILRMYDLMFFRKPSILHWSLSSAQWPYLLLWGRRLPNPSSMILLLLPSFLCGKKKKTWKKEKNNGKGYLSGLGRPKVESLIQFHGAETLGWIYAVSL